MLLNLHKKGWEEGMTLTHYGDHCQANENTIAEMLKLVRWRPRLVSGCLTSLGLHKLRRLSAVCCAVFSTWC